MSKVYIITQTANHTTGHGSSEDSTELCRTDWHGPFAPAFTTREAAQAYIDRDQAKDFGKRKLWEPGITELKLS